MRRGKHLQRNADKFATINKNAAPLLPPNSHIFHINCTTFSTKSTLGHHPEALAEQSGLKMWLKTLKIGKYLRRKSNSTQLTPANNKRRLTTTSPSNELPNEIPLTIRYSLSAHERIAITRVIIINFKTLYQNAFYANRIKCKNSDIHLDKIFHKILIKMQGKINSSHTN